MQRRMWILAAALIAIFIFSQSGYAFWGSSKKAAPAAKKEEPAKKEEAAKTTEAKAADVKEAKTLPAAASSATLAKQKAIRDRKKAAVNNNQWDVDVVAMSGKGGKKTDTLIFKDNMFSSANFDKAGFVPSNYTLTVADDGSAVVETMQSSAKEGIIFWRIELGSDLATCKGILSRQLSDNKTEDFSFSSTGRKTVAPEPATASEVPAVSAAPVAPAVQTQAQTPATETKK